MIEEDDESYGEKLKATKNAVYLDIYRIYAGKKIEYSKEAYRAGYEKEDDLARCLCPGNILMSDQYTAHLTFQILYLICILLVNVGILKLYPGFPQENCLKIRKEGNDMFSKKEKIGTTLSLILSLCLMLTGVFFGLPAIGSFAAGENVLYDGTTPTVIHTGNAIEPEITLLDGEYEIPEDEYREPVFTNNVDTGTATVTIRDKDGGNYSFDTITQNFLILSASDGVKFTSENDDAMTPGDVIKTEKIEGYYYTTEADGSTTRGNNIDPDDIWLVKASDWEGKTADEQTALVTDGAKLVKTLKIVAYDRESHEIDYTDPEYIYYVIVKNPSIGGGHYYSFKKTVYTSENRTGFDSNIWYQTKDAQSGITWNYKLNGDGDIIGLYTLDTTIDAIVDKNKCLNIPAKVADRTVIYIGGDSKDHPVVPSGLSRWQSLSLPSTVTRINDYAFYQTQAPADITIPSTVDWIGEQAFYNSKINSVKISEMNGKIGSNAFGKLTNMGTLEVDSKIHPGNIYVKGGANGLTVSRVAFADTNASSITLKGNIDVHEYAFRNCSNVKEIYIGGSNIILGESAFSNATSLGTAIGTDTSGDPILGTLEIAGSVDIGENAFYNAAALTTVYLPSGVTLHNNSFNGAVALTNLESDTNLVSGSFNNTGAVKVLLLDEHVTEVAHDWEGHSSTVTGDSTTKGRYIYVRNPETRFGTYTDGDDHYSAYGSSGYIQVYYMSGGTNEGTSLAPDERSGEFSTNSYTYDAGGDAYTVYYTGKATQIFFSETENITTAMSNGNVISAHDMAAQKTQTGIVAFYSDKILTTKDIDKNKMSVIKVLGNDEGDAYSPDEFYVVRATEFAAEQKKPGGVTEPAIAKYEPVNAKDTDLETGKKTGTIAVDVIVFYDYDTGEKDGENNPITERRYYFAPVSIRVEEYTAKSDIEQAYGSYEAIAERLAALDKQIAALNKELGATAGSTEEIAKLTTEIANLKKSYADAVDKLKAYTQNNNPSEDSGYMGTAKINDVETAVIFINGEAVPYEDTGAVDAEGNKIYQVEYDADKDSVKETIYVIVKSDGVHQVEPVNNGDVSQGVTPKTDNRGDEVIWKDTLAALQRQMTAELAAMQAKINSLSSMLNNITNTINENTGEITIDPTLPIDEQTLAIINEINRLYDAEAELDAINTGKYTDALNTIYSKLAGKNFTEEELGDLDNVLNTINAQIEKDKTEIESSKATIEDIKEALSDSEARSEELKQKIDENTAEITRKANAITAKETEIQNKETAIATAEAELEDLRNQLAEATDPETITTLEGDIESKIAEITRLTNEKTDLESAKATLEDEKTALEAKAVTLAQAQNTLATLQGKIAEKDAQITQLQADLAATGATAQAYSETVRTAGELFKTTDDARIAEAIRNYVSANATMSTTIGKIQQAVNSTNNGDALVADINAAIAGTGSGSGTTTPDAAALTAKYNEGYAAGLAASTTATEKEKLDAEYTKGYNAGYAAAPKTSTADTASLNAKYNEGYNAGVSSVNTTSYYNNGYNAGYTAGLKAGSGTGNTELTTQVTSLTSQVTSLTTENTKLAGQVSTLKTDNAALKTELDSLKTNNTELSSKVNDLTTNNTELTGKVDDLTGKNQSLSGQVNDLTTRNNDLAGQITSLNGQVATLQANNNRTTNTGTGNTSNAATNTTNTNANTNTGTNTTRPTNVTSAANTNNGTANNGTTASAANNQGTTGRTSGTSATSAATSSAGRTSATSSATSASPLYGNLSSTPSSDAAARSIKITQFENAGTTPASGQVATVNLVKLTNADTKGIKTNAMKSAPITDADKEEAEIVINYYMNHLSELGSLGSTEISDAAKDDTKDVAFNEVLAADFTASDAQNKEITEKGKTSLTIASDDIVNGGTYLVIHKSNKRSGMYDVLLTKASGNEIAMTLQDLSPVTIVKVSVAPIGGTAAVADRSVTEAAPAKNMSKLWIAIGICAAVVGAFIFLMVLIKMRGKKRDRREPAYAGDGNGDFEEVDDQYEDEYEDDPEPYDEPNQG